MTEFFANIIAGVIMILFGKGATEAEKAEEALKSQAATATDAKAQTDELRNATTDKEKADVARDLANNSF